MDHFVRLNRAIDDLEFPPDLKGRIHVDPIRKRLVFRGFMSKADYDRLSRLRQDSEYLAAVDRLFRISTEEDDPHYGKYRRAVVVLGVVGVALAGLAWWRWF